MRSCKSLISLALLAASYVVSATSAVAASAVAASQTIKHGEATIEYKVDGAGPPVLMIASLGRPASDYDHLAQVLVDAGYSTIRPEPRGIGGSSGPMQALTLDDLAGDALATVPADAKELIVIGHAFGQRVSSLLATRHPEKIKRVVMLAAGGKAPMQPGAEAALMASFNLKLSPEQHMDAVNYAFFAPGNDPEVWRDGWHAKVAKMQITAAKAQPTEDWWGAGKAKVLVIQGEQDKIATPENGELLKQEFGDRITLQRVNNAGHALIAEQPQIIADSVLEFLKAK
ncbi:alpha/beta hydrolase [Pseudomonas sp.]|uniref:alpha/beta fold hydrolase n=1 Tax=Pseudomonas sp. TaxID=306 RepID=UPI00257D1CF9|nr:alpha/beta hydrolase [Pseudomonas sp.]